MMLAANLVLILLPALIAVDLLLPRGRSRAGRVRDALGLAPVVGLGIATLLDFGLRLGLGRNLRLLDLTIAWAALIVLALLGRARRRASDRAGPAEGAGATSLVRMLGAAAGLVIAGTLFFGMRSNPQGSWDGMAIWNLLGRALASSEGDAGPMLKAMVLSHSEYPHFLPGSIAIFLREAGREAVWPGQFAALLGLFSLFALAQRSLAVLRGEYVAAIGAILLVATPTFVLRCSDQYADTWLAAINVGAAGFIAAGLLRPAGSRRHLLIGGLLLGLLPWTKQEGIPMAMVLALTTLVVCLARRPRGRGLADLGMVVIGSAPGLAASLLLRFHWVNLDRRMDSSFAEIRDLILDGSRWQPVWKHLATEITTGGQLLLWNAPGGFNPPLQRWAFFWPALVLLGLIWFRRSGFLRRETLFVGIALLGQVVALMLIFVIVPFRQEWHLETAFHRVLMQVAPIALLFVVVLGRPVAAGSGEPEMEGEPGVDDPKPAALVEGEGGGVA